MLTLMTDCENFLLYGVWIGKKIKIAKKIAWHTRETAKGKNNVRGAFPVPRNK
ncbi:MAG: hypothetical protein JRG74_07490 [Deltaproteobacteria bacterium]|nr:hypothetical protein [Deltaproteobacteria bacterium]